MPPKLVQISVNNAIRRQSFSAQYTQKPFVTRDPLGQLTVLPKPGSWIREGPRWMCRRGSKGGRSKGRPYPSIPYSRPFFPVHFCPRQPLFSASVPVLPSGIEGWGVGNGRGKEGTDGEWRTYLQLTPLPQSKILDLPLTIVGTQ